MLTVKWKGVVRESAAVSRLWRERARETEIGREAAADRDELGYPVHSLLAGSLTTSPVDAPFRGFILSSRGHHQNTR